MDPIDQQLLDLNHQNRILRLQLEATREAGIQALKSASQRFSETYKKKQEELKKSHHEEKQRMEAGRIIELRKEWRKKMAEEEETKAAHGGSGREAAKDGGGAANAERQETQPGAAAPPASLPDLRPFAGGDQDLGRSAGPPAGCDAEATWRLAWGHSSK
ncbi:coiled-coil domain-containing protein 68 isoform X2 [Lagopus muta]|uniref:coiled-coil domain-containing protein 68 isoform X2 n=1 Tax=Lagopus muta TaxID=64668 RepID=UPI00209F2D9C|nr:coiled-coil domain-containing protein 68 isoform X2 [Lagopus muta]